MGGSSIARASGTLSVVKRSSIAQLNPFEFDWAQWSLNNHLESGYVLISGRTDEVNFDIVRERLFPGREWCYLVTTNNHIFEDYPAIAVYHSVKSVPLNNIRKIAASSSWLFLNLVDGDYEQGRSESPAYAEVLSEINLINSPPVHKPVVGFFAQGTWEQSNPYGPQYEWLNRIHKKFNTKLFTGLVALASIMQTKVRGIGLTGMTLFVEQTKGNRDSVIDSHDIAGNLAFLEWALKTDSRIVIDEPLREALQTYGVL